MSATTDANVAAALRALQTALAEDAAAEKADLDQAQAALAAAGAEELRLRQLLIAHSINPDTGNPVDPGPPVPAKTLEASLPAPGVARGTWVGGWTPVELGRDGDPKYGGTPGWNTGLIGGIPPEWLAQGFADFLEAAPGVEWTLYGIEADGTRHEAKITPPDPNLHVDAGSPTGSTL